ncbi:toprim domain-containing protein [Tateyamaria armeniaca]|uniref:Toprim domain-containing protein n=1 Tax=Tateyamaria armeniaca TaxID=2518930 RepID=A0ABW8UPI3_9RHOB
MPSPATELSHQLARNAETVCRHYLSNGRKQGHYWLVGDAQNNPGRSMYVRLSGPLSGTRAAGKWTDAATGEHGDLLDVIRESCGLVDFKDVADEARRFLSLPLLDPPRQHSPHSRPSAATGSQEAARRLFAMGVPIRATPVENYLRGRGIGTADRMPSLRFHSACFYRPEAGGSVARLPAMLAAITDLEGRHTGTHRTWLRPDGSAKADIDTPRRAMGALLGNAVRFGVPADVLVAGEGIETVLSVRSALPEIPALAALSSGHLAATRFPAGLQRLYVLRDRDPAGAAASDRLQPRAAEIGIEAVTLTPRLGDFNDDLRRYGLAALRARLRLRLHAEDAERFMPV